MTMDGQTGALTVAPGARLMGRAAADPDSTSLFLNPSELTGQRRQRVPRETS
jgi:hypothetical protein